MSSLTDVIFLNKVYECEICGKIKWSYRIVWKNIVDPTASPPTTVCEDCVHDGTLARIMSEHGAVGMFIRRGDNDMKLICPTCGCQDIEYVLADPEMFEPDVREQYKGCMIYRCTNCSLLHTQIQPFVGMHEPVTPNINSETRADQEENGVNLDLIRLFVCQRIISTHLYAPPASD